MESGEEKRMKRTTVSCGGELLKTLLVTSLRRNLEDENGGYEDAQR